MRRVEIIILILVIINLVLVLARTYQNREKYTTTLSLIGKWHILLGDNLVMEFADNGKWGWIGLLQANKAITLSTSYTLNGNNQIVTTIPNSVSFTATYLPETDQLNLTIQGTTYGPFSRFNEQTAYPWAGKWLRPTSDMVVNLGRYGDVTFTSTTNSRPPFSGTYNFSGRFEMTVDQMVDGKYFEFTYNPSTPNQLNLAFIDPITREVKHAGYLTRQTST